MTSNLNWARRGLDYEPPEIDTSVPHSARVYDYVLGGKDNYPPDREAAERMLAGWPSLRISMRQNRHFMRRAVHYAASELGIDQFLDIGTGIPTSPNLHEVAQGVNPTARVVYVDNDPIVLAHAEARLNSTPAGRIRYIHADMRDADAVLTAPELHETIDLGRPVALSIIAVIQIVTDDRESYEMVRRYLEPLPAGSLLSLSTVTEDPDPEGIRPVVEEYNKRGIPAKARTRAEVARYFDGLEILDPGVVLTHRWRPDETAAGVEDKENAMWSGVAIKRETA
jgi:hypothetical protein